MAIETRDAGDSFERELLAVFRPDDTKGVVDYLAKNMSYMPGPTGRFQPDFFPFILEPLEATFDPEVRSVTNLACVQAGKSAHLALSAAYLVAKAPAHCVIYQASNGEARDFHRQVIRPIWEGIPDVKALIPEGKSIRWDSITLGRAHIWTRGQETQNNLNRISARYVFCDEVWAWKPTHLRMAARRSLAFGWLGKLVIGSQAGWKDDDLDRHWHTTTMEEWNWPCPSCQAVQPFNWDQVRLPEGALTADGVNDTLVKTGTTYECVSCKTRLEDTEEMRNALNAAGRYVRTNLNADPAHRGFHWNALAARPWGETAIEWARAKLAQTNGDDKPLEVFRQQQLATAVDRSTMDTTEDITPGLFKLREDWAEEGAYHLSRRELLETRDEKDPAQARLRFVGVDVQRDGFYTLCRSYSMDGRSRLYDWGYFNTIDEVDSFRKRCGVIAPFTFVDSGDQQDFVHRQAARLGWNCTRGTKKNDFAWPVRGVDGVAKVKVKPYSKPREVEPSKGLVTRVYYYGNLAFKDLLWRLRRSGIHQYPVDAGDDYIKQMTAERRVISNSGQPIWKCPRRRANHLWDCEVILMLPALVFGLAGEAKATKGEVQEQTNKPEEAEVEAEDGPAED